MLVTHTTKEAEPLRRLVEAQNRKILIGWALACAPRIMEIWDKTKADDPRPRQALEAAESWARGTIKMPEAKKAAHRAHNAATEAEGLAAPQAAARAMGHVVGIVHVKTHAMGIVYYGITARVYDAGVTGEQARQMIVNELDWFYSQLEMWLENPEKDTGPWAEFLQKEV